MYENENWGEKRVVEVLFEAKVVRTMGSNHPNMLPLTEQGASVKVFAIKLSDRPDFWEAQVLFYLPILLT